MSPREITEKLIAIWKKYTILENELLRERAGKPVYFFLQPNQYLKDSKPLSEQERRLAIDPLRVEGTHEMMTLLKAAVQDLHHSGVPGADLTGIFASTTETVYKDDCCHLNALGNQIMADTIVSNVMTRQSAGARQSPSRSE
jgi:lysophospholipase L1-like esterase